MSYKVGTILARKDEQKDAYDRVTVTGTSPIKDENDANWVGSSNSLLVTPTDEFEATVPLSVARANKEYAIEFTPEEGLAVNQTEKGIGDQLTPEEQFHAETVEAPAPPAPPKPPVKAPPAAPEPDDEDK